MVVPYFYIQFDKFLCVFLFSFSEKKVERGKKKANFLDISNCNYTRSQKNKRITDKSGITDMGEAPMKACDVTEVNAENDSVRNSARERNSVSIQFGEINQKRKRKVLNTEQ